MAGGEPEITWTAVRVAAVDSRHAPYVFTVAGGTGRNAAPERRQGAGYLSRRPRRMAPAPAINEPTAMPVSAVSARAS